MSSTSLAGRVAFGYPDFRNFFGTSVLGSLAVEMQITAVSWQVYQLTGDPLHLGLVGLAQFAPFPLLFLAAGAAADRFPRVRIVQATMAVQLLCAAAFLTVTVGDAATMPMIFSILILLGVARAFQSPARPAILPLLVPPEHFPNAVAWNSAGSQTARIGGPAVAGALLILGVEVVYGAVVVLAAAALGFAFRVHARSQILDKGRPTLRTILAGFRFIWSRPVILGAISLDLFAVLLGGATALLPIFAVDILGVGAVGYGALRASHVIGSLVSSLVLTQRPILRRAGSKLLASVAVFGAATCVFGLSTTFWLSFLALFALGAADAVSVFIRSNLVQVITPDAMRGRVSAVNSIFIGASNELGEFESGVTAAWWGVVPAVLVGGIGTIVVAVVFGFAIPRLRRVDSLDHIRLIRDHREVTGPPGG
ncbi:MAG: MFS transporter [Actinobacteria bacterium]|nr:MFS transporter [Actinomycetota bacterium]MBU1494662.1 MFS transporter [Actinomycetota bacterium]MBU1866561.1 MFS transporter [Actinomycetota bacterium]